MLGDRPEPQRPDHIGPYEIEAWLGEGGMGEVARARDRRLERRVAIKRIRGARLHERSTRERFRREAWSVAQLNHPAIVQIYDIVSDEEHDWIVMELVEGETLTKRLKRGPLDPAVALTLMRDVAAGLAEAHDAGIVHRDIKADNIMITPKGGAKILDFGLARPIEPDTINPAVTMVGAILGTPHAMSPEQATGRDIDHRSDLFSLGSLFYLAVTGRSPFRGPTALETLRRVRTRSQPPAKWLRPELPEALSDLIDELLQKEPDQRPQDTSEIARRLEQMVHTPFPEGKPVDDGGDGDWAADGLEDSLTAVTEMTSIVSAGQRQVTVLVCEPVSPPDAPLPESVRQEVADDLRKLTREILEEFGAELQPAPGHDESSPAVSTAGAVACFGFPRAEEDDARYAVLAARRLVHRVRDAWTRDARQRDAVALRVGVHTGPSTIQGEERSNEIDLGETGETAAAMMRSAAAHEVVVSRVTEALIQPLFRCEALARPPADGATPYRVVGERDVEGHLELLRRSPIVGREPEKAILLRRWRQVQEGRGQAILLCGPAGSGKSRLLQELLDNEATADAFRLVCRCHRHEQDFPLAPLVRLLRRLLGCDESAEVSRDDLAAFVEPFDANLGDALPAFSRLVAQSLDKSEDVTLQPDDNVGGENLEAVLRLLTAMSERHPVLLLVEDVGWIDDGTRDLLSRLLHQGPTASILVVLTSRWPWDLAGVDHLGQLSLGLLDRQQSETLVRRLAPRNLPEVAVESILKRADGVPLFLEELTRALCESDIDLANGDVDVLTSELAFLAIPPRLQDFFMAKLDSLGSGRRLAQEAAVIGRSVPRKVLDAVTSFEPSEVDRLLDRLVEHELLYQHGSGQQTRYLFRYALLQEAAYRSLPARERHAVHGAVTRALVRNEG